LRFIEEAPGNVGKREIARAFHIGGEDREALKVMLRELHAEGHIAKGDRRRFGGRGALPNVTVIAVVKAGRDGYYTARPVEWPNAEEPPLIVLPPQAHAGPALEPGDRLLARLARDGKGYEARIIRRLSAAADRLLGIYTETAAGTGRVVPTDKRQKFELTVPAGKEGGARKGELVLVETVPGRRLGLREAHVVERLGATQGLESVSLISVHTHELPHVFSEAALAEARKAKPVALGRRRDLRPLPLVTIDGEDARDFDDAVFAEPDDDPANPGGWHVVVAIADVAHYVRPGHALDREALERGNSVYFPDRVIPMLPEELSGDLCSLRQGVNRAVLAVSMRFDRDGNKRSHEFCRGLMRSAARLTYTQVQMAREGRTDEQTGPLAGPVLAPLFGAFEALSKARHRRSPLELNLPEMQVMFAEDGSIAGVRRRPQLESHRLIEEFMIAANVAAAETLEELRQPCMYRVHAPPERERMRGLKEFLATLDLNLTLGETVRPELFNRILAKAEGTEFAEVVNMAILRTQSQAYYAPDNLGHFGLALSRYAHFTSPIRRYADLLVHRALIRGLKLGAGGLPEHDEETFARIGEQISNAERRAMAAERDAVDRFIAAYMADKVGASFPGRVAGISRAGLFVRLNETGGDGLVPISTLGDEYFELVEAEQALVGRDTGYRFRLGDVVEVRLVEASPVTGGLLLELLDGGAPGKRPHRRRQGRAPLRGRAKRGR